MRFLEKLVNAVLELFRPMAEAKTQEMERRGWVPLQPESPPSQTETQEWVPPPPTPAVEKPTPSKSQQR